MTSANGIVYAASMAHRARAQTRCSRSTGRPARSSGGSAARQLGQRRPGRRGRHRLLGLGLRPVRRGATATTSSTPSASTGSRPSSRCEAGRASVSEHERLPFSGRRLTTQVHGHTARRRTSSREHISLPGRTAALRRHPLGELDVGGPTSFHVWPAFRSLERGEDRRCQMFARTGVDRLLERQRGVVVDRIGLYPQTYARATRLRTSVRPVGVTMCTSRCRPGKVARWSRRARPSWTRQARPTAHRCGASRARVVRRPRQYAWSRGGAPYQWTVRIE